MKAGWAQMAVEGLKEHTDFWRGAFIALVSSIGAASITLLGGYLTIGSKLIGPAEVDERAKYVFAQNDQYGRDRVLIFDKIGELPEIKAGVARLQVSQTEITVKLDQILKRVHGQPQDR